MSSDDALLETGHTPTTPIGDTYLRRFLFNWTTAIAALAESLGGHTMRRDDLWAADVGRAAGYANTATLLQPLDPLHPESVLDSLNRFYRYGSGDTMGEMSLFSGWPTPNLRPHGWYLIGHPPLHLLPADATAPPPPPELTIEPVTDAAGLRSFETTIIQGYPFPELAAMGTGAMLGEGVLADPRFRLFVGRVGDQPVSAAGAFVEHGLSNVIIVATTPAARRRGYGEALTWRAALAEPGLPAMLLSSDDGRPVYERMGFMPLFRCTLWYRQRTG